MRDLTGAVDVLCPAYRAPMTGGHLGETSLLSAALDRLGVDEVLVEVLELAVGQGRGQLHPGSAKDYVGIVGSGGTTIAAYVHPTRLSLTLPQHVAERWSQRLGTVHDHRSDPTHLIIKSAELTKDSEAINETQRALAVDAISAALEFSTTGRVR